MQSALGIFLGMISDVETTGGEDLDITVWVGRVQLLGQGLLVLSSYSGLNVTAITTALSKSNLITTSLASAPTKYEVELLLAKILYYGVIPAFRQYAALWLADTWVFFIHRLEHSHSWLYSTSGPNSKALEPRLMS